MAVKLLGGKSKKGGKDIDMNYLNPRGLFSVWSGGHDFADLTEGIPRTVRVASSSGREVRLLFAGFKTSPPLDSGKYAISVDFLKMGGKRPEKVASLERTLHVDAHWRGGGHMMGSELVGREIKWV